jgi:predicted acyltransferase
MEDVVRHNVVLQSKITAMRHLMSTLPYQSLNEAPIATSRLLSIDLLRGLTLAFMILVNDNGSDKAAYWALNHTAWNGFTPTDLVFPTFLFVIGITIVLSTSKRRQQGSSSTKLIVHIVRRAAILFLLGLVVNSAPLFHLSTLRFYGVLPRIALCYLVVAVYYTLNANWRNKLFALVALLAAYWALMRLVPVPGYGLPGRDVPLLDHNGNLAAWLDRQMFSSAHLYERTRDPEGLLSTLPAIATTLLGLLTGLWLKTKHSLSFKLRGILIAGVSSILVGGFWNIWFPINKKLWTSSYVLFAGGLSLLLLALFLWFADMRKLRRIGAETSVFETSLLVFGTNAIFAYVLSEVLASCLDTISGWRGGNLHAAFYQIILAVVPNAAFASLLYSLIYVAVCWLVVYVFLYRRKIFLKI